MKIVKHLRLSCWDLSLRIPVLPHLTKTGLTVCFCLSLESRKAFATMIKLRPGAGYPRYVFVD
jgi:hypothetical protein